MSVLTDEAEKARLAQEAKDAAAVDAERKALRTAALDAIRAMLVRPDGTTMTLSDAGLAAVFTDLANGLVVASDGTINLAARRGKDGAWDVYLVTGSGSTWTKASDDLNTLADLGEALKVVAA